MDHRLKLVKYLIKKVSLGETVDFSSMPVVDSDTEKKKTAREKELEFYEKLKKATPDGWDFEVLHPGKESDAIRPDVFLTRKSDGKRIKVEAKSLNSSKHVRVGCTNTLSFSCSGTSAHEGIKGLASTTSPSGSRRWPIGKNDEDQMKQWQEYAAEVSRKSDLHIIGNDDEIHLVWPHENESNVPEHVSDFLNSTGLQITHFIQHVTKSGNPVHYPPESERGERVVIRARLSQGRPSSSEETFSSQNARQMQLIASKKTKAKKRK